MTRSTVTFLPVYKDKREAVEHNGRRPVCGKPHTMEETQVTCFIKQNEIAWFSISTATLVITISVQYYS